MTARVGVLALQGASGPHLTVFSRMGPGAREVRRRSDLPGLTHLVLPGGESTTIHHLLELFELRDEIVARHRAGELALFGVCAGAILLGREPAGSSATAGRPTSPGMAERPPRLALADVEVERNAYGRQLDSFTRDVRAPFLDSELHCVFIRAPKIRRVGPGLRVLARDGEDPILVEGPGLLLATFHPELAGDRRIHERFLTRSVTRRPSRSGCSCR